MPRSPKREAVQNVDPTAPLVVVEDLGVRYRNGTQALSAVSLTVGRGERVALVGESGSGKSTLAMAIAGFLKQTDIDRIDGAITFDGVQTEAAQAGLLPQRTPGISVVFQDAMTSLDPVWTIGSQLTAIIRTAERCGRKAARVRAVEWLGRVGLTDHHRVLGARPYELSGGMRQRVMIALALASKPRLLIADEPTSALDASLAQATMDLLVELAQETGVSLLMVTHDLELCMRYVDRVAVMYQGEIVETGETTDLASNAKHPYTKGLLFCVPTLANAEDEYLPTLARFMSDQEVAAS
jgi:ABC-type dipeptide/oligopeptide/nickel transport system ATPase component